MRNHSLLLALSAALILAAGCSRPSAAPAPPPDTRIADEAAIRQADADWAQWAMAKDLDKCMSQYEADAVAFAPGMPAYIGKDNIRKFIAGLLASPHLHLEIHVARVDVARSGDLAMDRGTASATVTGKNGKPATSSSAYVLVWKKQPDGSWKIAADTSASVK